MNLLTQRGAPHQQNTTNHVVSKSSSGFMLNFRHFWASISSNSTVRLTALRALPQLRAARYNAQKGGPNAAPRNSRRVHEGRPILEVDRRLTWRGALDRLATRLPSSIGPSKNRVTSTTYRSRSFFPLFAMVTKRPSLSAAIALMPAGVLGRSEIMRSVRLVVHGVFAPSEPSERGIKPFYVAKANANAWLVDGRFRRPFTPFAGVLADPPLQDCRIGAAQGRRSAFA
jgi:hypothetical protein